MTRPASAASPSPVSPCRGGVRVTVRLTPRAAASRVTGMALDDAGTRALKVSVTAPPEDGKANAALLKLLAKVCGRPPSALAIVSGLQHRIKVVAIAGDPPALMRRLEEAGLHVREL